MSHTFRYSYYYYLFPEMSSYPVFWLSLGVTNVVALMPVFVIKWWLLQYVQCALVRARSGKVLMMWCVQV